MRRKTEECREGRKNLKFILDEVLEAPHPVLIPFCRTSTVMTELEWKIGGEMSEKRPVTSSGQGATTRRKGGKARAVEIESEQRRMDAQHCGSEVDG